MSLLPQSPRTEKLTQLYSLESGLDTIDLPLLHSLPAWSSRPNPDLRPTLLALET